jgi:putative ABC transport system substrate-binding protein
MNKNKYLHVARLRRRLLAAGAALPALAWIGATRAQAPAAMRRIGVISGVSSSRAAPWNEALRDGLRDRGWIEGRNISIEYRFAEHQIDRLPALAADLVRLNVEVIVASAVIDAKAAQKATTAIPIVVAAPGDPVASGLVNSLARPGGNVTGLTQMSPELGGKRLELLKDTLPKLSRVAVLWNPQGAVSPHSWKEIQGPARKLGIQLQSLEVSNFSDLDKALAGAALARAGALFITPDPVNFSNMKKIAEITAKSRLPSVHYDADYANAGGLMSYGADRADLYRRAATYVDKILKGAKPGDLPIEQPTKFELVINLRTAKAIGLSIPQNVLFRANRVIE